MGQKMTKTKSTTIIVPVYGDWPSLKECIASLKIYISPEEKVLLVNDCGPEADLLESNIQTAIKSHKNFHYFRNNSNMGFVGTCNRAVYELDKTDNDILLLNSDTKVTQGFLTEMKTVLYIQDNIGAVSPRSNNATICTIPLSAIAQKGIDADASYGLFQVYKHMFPQYNQVPTAHGFCMLIRRSLIKKYKLFDTTFGKGYGEEVDFCQRIQDRGWLCVLSNWSYVFHLEARSFSAETKAQLLSTNNKIIHARYPGYQQRVRDYIDGAQKEEARILGVSPTKRRTKTAIKQLAARRPWLRKLARAAKKRLR